MPLVKRLVKGSELTYSEGDGNLDYVELVRGDVDVWRSVDVRDGGNITADIGAAINSCFNIIGRVNIGAGSVGKTIHIPAGQYPLLTTISLLGLSNAQAGGENRDLPGITIEGKGPKATIIYVSASGPANVLNVDQALGHSGSVDQFTLRNLTIRTSFPFTGAGDKILRFVMSQRLRMENVQIIIHDPHSTYNDTAIFMEMCGWNPASLSNVNVINYAAGTEAHAITGGTVNRLGMTGFYFHDNNGLNLYACGGENLGRIAVFDSEGGATWHGGNVNHFNCGFLFTGTVGSSTYDTAPTIACKIQGFRCERNNSNTISYIEPTPSDGYLLSFGPGTSGNDVEILSSGSSVASTETIDGVFDLGGNTWRVNGSGGRTGPITRTNEKLVNGCFLSWLTHTSAPTYRPSAWGWGAGTFVMAKESTDLPPARNVRAALRYTTDTGGWIYNAFTIDPEKEPGISFRTWMKRLAGSTSIPRFGLRDAGSNVFTYSMVSASGDWDNAIPIASASWSAGVATYTFSRPHLLNHTGCRFTVSTMTPSAYNGARQVATIPSPTQFTAAMAADPGGAGGAGTATPDLDMAFLRGSPHADQWREYSGGFAFSHAVKEWVWNVGSDGKIRLTLDTTLHGLVVGMSLKLWGWSNTGTNLNGTWTITDISSAIVFFTVADPGTVNQIGRAGYIGTVRFQILMHYASGHTGNMDILLANMRGIGQSGNNMAPNLRTTDELYLSGEGGPEGVYEERFTVDPGSVAANAAQALTGSPFDVPGAALGDIVSTSFSINPAGTEFIGQVSASNTVAVYHRNMTGSPVDLGAGILTIRCRRTT